MTAAGLEIEVEYPGCQEHMPNCEFYAAGQDFRSILDFIFGQPDWTLVELASMPDRRIGR
jgi:hypothetical protein